MIRNSGNTPGAGHARSWAVLALIVLGAAVLRFGLLDVPLERDEGEYAYAGQLMLQGVPPYQQAYNMKMPGVYAAYAAIMAVSGETPRGIHSGLLLVNALTVLLLYLLGRRIGGSLAGLVAAGCFALLSLGQDVRGVFANAEHFVILFAVGGGLLLLDAVRGGRRTTLFAASLLFGICFVMKQHGAAFVVFGGLFLALSRWKARPGTWKPLVPDCFVYVAGAILPFALTCLLLLWAGVFDRFWFWTVDYASQYVSAVPVSVGATILVERLGRIAGFAPVVWALAALGLVVLFRRGADHTSRWFMVLFAACSCLAVIPGFYFRWHYFTFLLPAVALLAGTAAAAFLALLDKRQASRFLKAISAAFLVAGLLHGVWQQRTFLFEMTPAEAARATYGLNPFPESVEIAGYLAEHTEEGDRIAVMGSEPQIYFYANRRSATGYIYAYALMETHPFARSMQEEMIAQVEAAAPEFLVYVNVPTSWLARPGSEGLVFDWFKRYASAHYELAGVVDIADDITHYAWDEEALVYRARSPYWISILRRRQ